MTTHSYYLKIFKAPCNGDYKLYDFAVFGGFGLRTHTHKKLPGGFDDYLDFYLSTDGSTGNAYRADFEDWKAELMATQGSLNLN